MTELHLVKSQVAEAPSAEAEGFAEVVDMAEYVRQQSASLWAAVNTVTVGGTPEGRARVRRIAMDDAARYPGQIPTMLETTEAAIARQAALRHQKARQRDLLDTAAKLDLPDHWFRLLAIKPDLTVDEAFNRVEDYQIRRRQGLPPNTMLRSFGRRATNFLKKEGLL